MACLLSHTRGNAGLGPALRVVSVHGEEDVS